MSSVEKSFNEKELISIALRIIYEASNQGVKSCTFKDQKARLIYEDENFIDFDLDVDFDNDQQITLTRYMVRM